MSDIKRDNYITICGWMVTELGLKGADLVTYAVIYGFSQLKGQRYTGTANYIAQWANVSRQAIMDCLKKLTKNEYIIKFDRYENGVKFCEYCVNEKYVGGKESLQGDVKKVDKGCKESLQGGVKKVYKGCKESLHNNTRDIYIDNNKDNICSLPKPDHEKDFEELWAIYPRKQGKANARKAYLKAVKSGVTKEQVEAGIKNYVASINAKHTDYDYIKHGSTWFNQECWNDEYSSATPAAEEDYYREASITDDFDNI